MCRAVGPSLGLADTVVSPGQQGDTTCLSHQSDSQLGGWGERSEPQESRGPKAWCLLWEKFT